MMKQAKIILIFDFIFTIILMMVGFVLNLRIDIAIRIYLTFTFIILFILIFILKRESNEEIKSIIQKNPNLSVSAVSENFKVSEQRIEKIILKLKSEGPRGSIVDFPSNEIESKISKNKVLQIIILTVYTIIILIGIINTYLISQKAPNSTDFRFWATFSATSLILLLLGFKISDVAEKKLSLKKERITQRIRDFKIGNINVFRLPGVGFTMLSIILVILLYLYLLIPQNVLENLFMLNSPVFLIFVILGIISITLTLIGYFLGAIKINREKDLDK